MDNDAINSLTKKWTANLVYYFEDFDNETHSQRLSAYIDQKPLDKFKEANLIELNKERDRWKLTNKGIDLLESIKNIYQSGRIFPPPYRSATTTSTANWNTTWKSRTETYTTDYAKPC